ncbi:MAG: hypothetical protein WCP92_03245 [bacterium]
MKKSILLSIVAVMLFVMNNTMAQTPFAVTVYPIPTTYIVGSSSLTYCANSTGVDITLNNSAIGINYQLYKGGIIQGAVVPGTGAALTWTGQFAGTYTIVGINATTGCDANMTGNVVITSNPVPIFTANPGNATICESGTTSFSVTVTGATTYAWEVSTDGGISWSPVTNGGIYTGATTTTLTLTGVTNAMNNYKYRSVATITSTGCFATSTAGTLTVNPLAVITSQPVVNTNVCDLSSTSISVTATGATSYQWQVSINNGVTFTNITTGGGVYTGYNTAVLNINATASMNTYQYHCIIGSVGPCTIISNPSILTVNALPTAYTVGSSATQYCQSTPGVNITLSNSTSGIVYELWKNGIATGTTITGNGALLTWNNQLFGTYTIVATNPVTFCTKIMTGTATIVENPLPTAGTITWSAPCSDIQLSVTINNLTGTSPWIISVYDELSPGVPGSVIYTLGGITNASPTLTFMPTWTGTQNKYIYMQDAHGCAAWK